jgi:hypothetical protein
MERLVRAAMRTNGDEIDGVTFLYEGSCNNPHGIASIK